MWAPFMEPTATGSGKNRKRFPIERHRSRLPARSVATFHFTPDEAVIPAAECNHQPDVENYEEVAASHLFHRQLRLAAGPVGPGGGDHLVAVAADDRLQRHLDGEVEVLGEKGMDRLDD